jgi:hypothetical protein
VQLNTLDQMIRARKYYKAEVASLLGLRRTLARFN